MACWCWMCMKLIAVADKHSQLDSWKESQHYGSLSSTAMDDFNWVVEAKPWSMRLSHLWFFPLTVHNYHRSACSWYTSARIVFCLNLTCCQCSFDAFLETQMWRMCDRNKTRDWEHNWRIYFQELCPSLCPYSWNTIYNTCGVRLKTGSLRTKRKLLLCHNRLNITQREWLGHEILFLQLCWYIRMIYSIDGGTSELGSTHDKTADMDYTRVTKSKGRVDSRVLGSSAMH